MTATLRSVSLSISNLTLCIELSIETAPRDLLDELGGWGLGNLDHMNDAISVGDTSADGDTDTRICILICMNKISLYIMNI